MEHKTVNRVLIGDDMSPDMIIVNNVIIDDAVEENKHIWKGDCEIRFYLGGRPVILHNDTCSPDNKKSLNEFKRKLGLIKSMTAEVLAWSKEKPSEGFLLREFLNTFDTAQERLFGGSLMIHYSPRFKIVTFDITDCTNKLRRSYGEKFFPQFANHVINIIDESLADITVLEGKLNGNPSYT